MTRIDVQREVLSLLESGEPQKPFQIVATVASKCGAPRSAVRQAIWHLLDEDRLKLTSDMRVAAARRLVAA